ncbi:MAG: hypothetical protein CVV24_02525 [Ignavibacteriae bacterium HGW-Ignavibacteriae-3]|nr:MAG: hypothetical protein CVV24_02525 [Ignavibacteriae bacterium HGW-Ignavibacteriae-3]
MRKIAIVVLVQFFVIFHIELSAQDKGELLFSQKCISCHTIGKGKLIGPDLSNITKKRNEAWLIKFIHSSQTLINSGDSTAVAVFGQYNNILMPDQNLSNAEILSVLEHIKINSVDSQSPNTRTPSQIFSATYITKVDIENGLNIFDGTTKLTNNGAACLTCHNIENPIVTNGGLLSKDLTNTFSRMGAQGIDGILRNPPFPAMADAFQFHQLTDQEIKNLLALLYYVDKKGPVIIPKTEKESSLLIGVALASNLMLVILLLLWIRVKKKSVNFH